MVHASVPSHRVMTADSSGLAPSSHRRGVMPLVTLVNCSGHSSAKSGKSRERTRLECTLATPLTVCEPTSASTAMRTALGSLSSMMDMRDSLSVSPGYTAATSSRKRWLIS